MMHGAGPRPTQVQSAGKQGGTAADRKKPVPHENFRDVRIRPHCVIDLLLIKDSHGKQPWQEMLRRCIAEAPP